MKEFDLSATIIAVATPPGQGALGLIRLSGSESLSIARKIFQANRDWAPWRLIKGRLIDFEKNEPFDEATAVYFSAPHSYTTEDMVEIICHGSPVIMEEIIRLGLKAGARMAHAGEFTLRAYLNGRIDLLQAEAVNDLVQATSLRQARLSFHQLDGRLSCKVDQLRQDLIKIISQVEAAIEFPDEGIDLNKKAMSQKIRSGSFEVEKLIQSYDLGQALIRGIKLAIVGRANVGKSTLFNALLEKDRAIVSPYPGTTRDYLEEKIKIGDFLFTLIDMAGLGEPAHPVEAEGIRRARLLADEADGLLVLLDNSEPFSDTDREILSLAEHKKAIFILNKIDLQARLDREKLGSFFQGNQVIEISALHGINLNELKTAIAEVFVPQADKEQEEVIFHWREKVALEEIKEALEQAQTCLEAGYSEEVMVEELRRAAKILGQITGEIRSEEVINAIFNEFCLGK